MVDEQLITSSNQLEGYKITKHLGIVRGITVRSRSLFGQHANEKGANAIINIRYDANEVINGVTEVLCYGTAVQVVNL